MSVDDFFGTFDWLPSIRKVRPLLKFFFIITVLNKRKASKDKGGY